MRAGTALIYHCALLDGDWLGYPGFLRRVDRPSALGDWSYEVVDAKLARESRVGALPQMVLYDPLALGPELPALGPAGALCRLGR